MTEEEFAALIKPGVKLRYWFGKNTPKPIGAVWHVRGIVDDDYIVLRAYSKERRRWLYFLEDVLGLFMSYQYGNLEFYSER